MKSQLSYTSFDAIVFMSADTYSALDTLLGKYTCFF